MDREAIFEFALRCAASVWVTPALVDLWLVQAQDEFVEMRWPKIVRVAVALLDQETLTADDVRGLVLPRASTGSVSWPHASIAGNSTVVTL